MVDYLLVELFPLSIGLPISPLDVPLVPDVPLDVPLVPPESTGPFGSLALGAIPLLVPEVLGEAEVSGLLIEPDVPEVPDVPDVPLAPERSPPLIDPEGGAP